MDEENQEPRSRVSKSFIFSIIIVAAIIGLVAFLIFSNASGAKTGTLNDFVHDLYDGHVTELSKVSGSTNVTLNWRTEKEDSNGKLIKTNWTYSLDRSDYEKVANYKLDINNDGLVDEKDYCSIYDIIRFSQEKYGDKIKVKADVDPYKTTWWEQWGPTIILIAGSALIAVFLLSRMTSTVNSSNRQAMDFNRSRARKANSKIKFSDVAGADEEKAEMEELVYYLKDPRKFTKFGAKLPKGVLLVGPPGCGKTLLAKAVAGEAGVPFFSISGSDFVEMFVGVGAGRVRDMFRVAKENAPCLVFIDEIDAVGRQRGAGLGGGNDEREQTLNQLLVEMDGFEDNSGIIVIAATNREDVLDPALLRAGRFDRIITVNLPDKKGREAIFKVHARGKLIDPKVSFENLAKRTVGFSGADIENILNEAAILAVRKNEPMITIGDIDEAIDRRIAGPAKSSKGMNANERKQVAYHEAGHAIIGLKLKNSDKVQKITIIPRGRTGGHVLMTPEDDRFLLSKSELEARIIGYLGGRSSEEIFFKDVSTGASNDIEVATRIARSMVTEYGMSSLGPIQYERDTGSVFLGRDYTSTQKNFSTQIAFEIDTEVRKIIEDAHQQALKIIKDNKDDVILIAETLLERETITAEEIDVLLKERSLKSLDEKKPGAKKEEPAPEVKPAEEAKEEK